MDRCYLRWLVSALLLTAACARAGEPGNGPDDGAGEEMRESVGSAPSAEPRLVERFTVLDPGETWACTALRNDGLETLALHVVAPTAVNLGAIPARLDPGSEVELVAAVDLGALRPGEHALPVQIITSAGTLLWSIEILADGVDTPSEAQLGFGTEAQ